jgi:hypothetical protein
MSEVIDHDSRLARYIHTQFVLGKDEWWITEELVKLGSLEREAAKSLVHRVGLGMRASARLHRREVVLGIIFLVVAFIAPALGGLSLISLLGGVLSGSMALCLIIHGGLALRRGSLGPRRGPHVPYRLGLFRSRRTFDDL